MKITIITLALFFALASFASCGDTTKVDIPANFIVYSKVLTYPDGEPMDATASIIFNRHGMRTVVLADSLSDIYKQGWYFTHLSEEEVLEGPESKYISGTSNLNLEFHKFGLGSGVIKVLLKPYLEQDDVVLVSEFEDINYIDITMKLSNTELIYRRFETELVEEPLIQIYEFEQHILKDYPTGSYIYKDNTGRKIVYSLDHETLEYSIESHEIEETEDTTEEVAVTANWTTFDQPNDEGSNCTKEE
jgi:hypothetical protein